MPPALPRISDSGHESADTTRVLASTSPDSVLALVDDLLRLNSFNLRKEYPLEFGSAERRPDGMIGISQATTAEPTTIGIRLRLGLVSREVRLTGPAFGAPEGWGRGWRGSAHSCMERLVG